MSQYPSFQSAATLLRRKLSATIEELADLAREVPVIHQHRDWDTLVRYVPDCKWGELTAEQRARQMELKRRYEEAHQLLRLILRGAPKNLLQRFQDADKRFRVWLEFEQLNWSLSAQPERNRSRVLQDGARLLETLAVVDAIGLHDVVIVPDMYSLLQRPDPADYRAVIGRGSFVFVLLPTVLAELGRLSLGHSNPDVRERARRVVANVKAWRRQGSLHGGVIVDGTITVFARYKDPDMSSTLPWLSPYVEDDRIIASILELQMEHPAATVVLVTGDVNLQNKAEAALINAVDAFAD